jgi:hypothetical protein
MNPQGVKQPSRKARGGKMAAHELDNKAERMESRQTRNLSSLAPELLQNGSFRQISKLESSATITNNGFPQLELVDGNTALMKSESALRLSSKYETGNEFTSDRELKQAGLNPKDVKHTVEKQDSGSTEESTSVKYPNGIEVTVVGRTTHMPSGRDVVMTPDASIKEPLPKGYHKDEDGAILDANHKKVAQINDDGTVTVKVGKGYLTQGPAGITETSVVEGKNGSGLVGRIPVKD